MTRALIDRREHAWGLELTGFGRPFGLGVDAAGRLHVTDMDRHHILRFDANLGSAEILGGPAAWNGPHSVDFAADGAAIVTCYYTPGIYLLGGDQPLELERALTGPASAFFADGERFLVAEYSQNAVLAFDRGGRLVGECAGRFDRPHMARALADGTILVADTWNNRLQRFEGDGTLIDEAVAAAACPVAIDACGQRGWLVTAWGDNVVVRFDSDGRPAGRLAAPDLLKPYDARWLAGDRVVVADSHHGRVLIINGPQFH